MHTIANASKILSSHNCDGWLVYDYRGSNPVFQQLLGTSFMLSRRTFLLVTKQQPPRFLVSRVDYTSEMPDQLKGIDIDRYSTWKQLVEWLDKNVAPLKVVAMEYSPSGELPNMSWVDGGTIDLVKAQGVTVISSAEVFQEAAAKWTKENLASHQRAMEGVVSIKDDAFNLVATRLRNNEDCDERLIQMFIEDRFANAGLVTDHPPIVSVNAHSGDPHYAPSNTSSTSINKGDWLLIDLWAKEDKPEGIFADITWVGYLGTEVPEKHMKVFREVAAARDAVVKHLSKNSGGTRGFELDQIARDVIERAGYGEYFVHRTGHSLSSGDAVHGLGANLDDYETHDTRKLAVGLGFTVEPGIYLSDFGVRSEINVYMSPDGPVITSPVQEEPLTFDL